MNKTLAAVMIGFGSLVVSTMAMADASCPRDTASFYDPNASCRVMPTFNWSSVNSNQTMCRFGGTRDGQMCKRSEPVACPAGYSLNDDAAGGLRDRCERRGVNGQLQVLAATCNAAHARTYTQNTTYLERRIGIGSSSTVQRFEVVEQHEILIPLVATAGVDQCVFVSDPVATKIIDLR